MKNNKAGQLLMTIFQKSFPIYPQYPSYAQHVTSEPSFLLNKWNKPKKNLYANFNNILEATSLWSNCYRKEKLANLFVPCSLRGNILCAAFPKQMFRSKNKIGCLVLNPWTVEHSRQEVEIYSLTPILGVLLGLEWDCNVTDSHLDM